MAVLTAWILPRSICAARLKRMPVSASDCTARPTQTFPRDYDGISRTFASDDILIETDGVTYSVSITGISESFDVDG